MENERGARPANVQWSREIDQVAAALAKAQGEITRATKSGKNQHINMRYATLDACYDACLPALNTHGLSVSQFPGAMTDLNEVSLTTLLMHESGQWMSNMVTVPVPAQQRRKGGEEFDAPGTPTVGAYRNPHSYGSAITYGRRFGLCALVGVAPDDDDGEAALQGRPAGRSAEQPARAAKPKPTAAPEPTAAPVAQQVAHKEPPAAPAQPKSPAALMLEHMQALGRTVTPRPGTPENLLWLGGCLDREPLPSLRDLSEDDRKLLVVQLGRAVRDRAACFGITKVILRDAASNREVRLALWNQLLGADPLCSSSEYLPAHWADLRRALEQEAEQAKTDHRANRARAEAEHYDAAADPFVEEVVA